MTQLDVTTPAASARTVWRVRLFASCLLLAAIAFIQSPGQIVNDTKYDLSERPALMLTKILHLWDPLGNFGQVQNQAYGYLFPMGPFFLLGDWVGLPPWVVQRLWWTLVLVVGFLGIVKLAGVLGIGKGWARILGGFAFALSPRMLTNTGPISIEDWPSSIAPWVLIPIVLASQGKGAIWRQSARSGVAAACVGGVNAVASAAIVPMVAIWVLTRKFSWRSVRLGLWSGLFVVMATLWWLVPLLVLGRYSPPFLDYIESAAATTAPANLADALRGTTKWVPYVSAEYSAGRQLLSDSFIILQGGIVVIVGALGLARRDLPERRFLLVTMFAGLFLVTMGHLGDPQGAFAPQLHTFLDAFGAPLRNTHKWDVLIRVPLVLGLVHFVAVVGTEVVNGRRLPVPDLKMLRLGVGCLVTAAFVGSASVVWSAAGLASAGSITETPQYWKQAADWLERHEDGRRTYVTPGSPFGDNLWGRPMDEAIQALSAAPWATRSVIPLVPGANIRMMDAIESRLVNGAGSSGLRDYLVRAGVGRVLVRNDLMPNESTPSLARVHQALERTPGLVRVATFGPEVGGETRLDEGKRSAVFVDDGRMAKYEAIEIYEVTDAGSAPTNAATYAVESLTRFVGDSASLLTSLEMGALGPAPVQFARDVSAGDAPEAWVLTDGSRRQEVDYGRVHDNRSASISEDEPWRTSRPVRDYDTGTSRRWLSVPELLGVRSILATSSASDVGFFAELVPAQQPFAAFDQDQSTSWVSGKAINGRHALTVRFDEPRSVSEVTLSAPAVQGARTRSVVVATDGGRVPTAMAPGDTTTVQLPTGPTSTLTVEAESDLLQPLRLSEVEIDGVTVTRPLVLPAVPASWGAPTTVVLAMDANYRDGCLVVRRDVRCAPSNERLGEDGRVLDRVVRMPAEADYGPHLSVAPWGAQELTDTIQAGSSVRVSSSSQAVHDARSGALAAVDGNVRTGWVADATDGDPAMTFRWDEAQILDRLEITNSLGLVAATPTQVALDFSNGESREVDITGGSARFDPVTADSVTVRFIGDDGAVSGSSLDGSGRELPVGVTELIWNGSSAAARAVISTSPEVRPCGTGPDIQIDDRTIRTKLTGSDADLFNGVSVEALPCGATTVSLAAGDRRITVRPTDSVRPVGLRLGEPAATVEGVSVSADEDQQRIVADVGQALAGDILLVRLNQNDGWTARQDGEKLTPLTLDGWQQGWKLTGDAKAVELVFAPDRTYRAGLWAGLATALLVLCAAFVPIRRRLRTEPVEAWEAGRVTATVFVLLAGWLLAGVPGLVATAVGTGLAWAMSSWSDRSVALWGGSVVGLGLVAVYLSYVVRPWGTDAVWAGHLAWVQLLALGVVAFGSLVGWGRRVRRPASRIAGRSTT